MSEPADFSQEFEYVEADLRYVVDDGQPSIRYVDWPEEAHKAHLPTYETHRVRIHNGRVSGERFTLAEHGFTLTPHHTAVKDFYDEAEVRRVYYPEIEQLVMAQTGARRVLVFDHTIRTPDTGRHAEGWIRETVKSVHNDYTERSAPKRVRDVLPPDEAERLLQRRFAIVQVWRSIAPRVESEPLAMCDGRSIPEVGFIRNERRYRDRTAETYHIAYNPAHRWFYFPYMTRDEALVFKVFDSDTSSEVGFTAHTSFDDPTTKPDAKMRESIEMRTFAFY